MNLMIGNNIKQLRLSKGITQEQLAEAMNVSCAAVSKWEREETYPDITLLQPLAYYFGVTVDQLMGYDQEKVRADIESVIKQYKSYWRTDFDKAREIIVKAYHDYPNDYWIMHYYMWNIGGDMADNDPNVLLAHKEEFLSICQKILDGCTEETLRLLAWNMRAKIMHAEGNTAKALEIYQTKFTSWYQTCGQKCEQLFAKETNEYYYHLQKNMYELAAFAADKLGRTIFFGQGITKDKVEKALQCGSLLLDAYEQTGEIFFAILAEAFVSRFKNDLTFRGGGEDKDIIALLDQNLKAVKIISDRIPDCEPLRKAFWSGDKTKENKSFLDWIVRWNLEPHTERKKQLLQNPDYIAVLEQYQ